MTGLLQDKVALVTGAGNGIGRGHALELARHGAKVVVNDLGSSVAGEGANSAAGEAVVAEIVAAGGEAVADPGNVAVEADADAMVQRAVDKFGRLDIAINNAGIVRDKAIWNMEVDDYDLVMNVHVRGSWLVSRAAARHWRERAKAGEGRVGGRLVNTTSGAGLLGNFGQTNYATAKAAIVGLSLTLNVELASIGVTVNVISPGGKTRITGTMPDGSGPGGAADADVAAFDPLDPAMASPVVAYLCSDRAAHVSGQVIRAFGEDLRLLEGWQPVATVDCGGERWDAEKLPDIFDKHIFGSRATGLTF